MSITLQDIHKTIGNLRREGHRLEEIEAFLINTDDLRELYRSAFERASASVVNTQGETHIAGMKIIDSQYVPSGSIFKIFKNGKQQMSYPGFTAIVEMPKHLRLPTVVNEKRTKKEPSLTRKIELG